MKPNRRVLGTVCAFVLWGCQGNLPDNTSTGVASGSSVGANASSTGSAKSGAAENSSVGTTGPGGNPMGAGGSGGSGPVGDLITDSANCGAVGNACGDGTGCFGGTCTTPTKMPENMEQNPYNKGEAAALGPDGRIYVFFGPSIVNATTTTVGIFDPRTNQWTEGPPPMPGVVNSEAVTLSNGKIAAYAWKQNIHILDPQQGMGTWSLGAKLPCPCPLLGGFALAANDKVFAFGGGQDGDPFKVLPTVQEYDSTSNSWTMTQSMPTPRFAVSTASVGGKIYVLGGTVPGDEVGGITNWIEYEFETVVEVYDPATGQWTSAAPLPEGISGRRAAVGQDGRIYVSGGFTNRPNLANPPTYIYEYFERLDVYDPIANSWAQGVAPSAAVLGAMVTGKDGRIYAFGGSSDGSFVLDGVVRVYEPTRGMWLN